MQSNKVINISLYLLIGIFVTCSLYSQHGLKNYNPLHLHNGAKDYDTTTSMKFNETFQERLKQQDTIKYFHLYCLGRDASLSKPELSMLVADSILSGSKRDNYPRGIISGYNLKGQLYSYSNNFIEALKNYRKAVEIGERYQDIDSVYIEDKLACTLYYLGDLYYHRDDCKNALSYYRSSFDILSQYTTEDYIREDSVFIHQGVEFTTLENDRAYASLSLAKVYIQEDNPDSSKKYLDITQSILDDAPEIRNGVKLNYYYGNYNLLVNDTTKAIDYFTESLNTSKYIRLNEYTVLNYLKLLKLSHYGGKEIDSVFKETERILKRMDMRIKLTELYNLYAEYLFESGDKELAYSYLKSSIELQSKVFKDENSRRFGQIEAGMKYQEQLNNLELEKLRAEQEEKRLETRLYFTFAIVSILIILISIVFYFYQKNKSQNKQLINLNKELKESKIQLEELNQSKTKLFRIISHDLKNPIIEFDKGLSWLAEKQEFGESSEDLKKMKAKAFNINQLLTSLLKWADSEIETPKVEFERLNLEKAISNTLELYSSLSQDKDLKLKVILNESSVSADKNLLDSILRNIFHNAIKYTDYAGRVEITSYSEDEFVILEIRNTGEPINQEIIDVVQNKKGFIGNYLTNKSGTGVGLQTVAENIEKIGGNMFIETEGDETVVTLYFKEGL